jgi:hypothetical protein
MRKPIVSTDRALLERTTTPTRVSGTKPRKLRKPPLPHAYEEFLRANVFPSLAYRVPGLHGSYVLHRELGGEEECVVITLFGSPDSASSAS